MLCLAFGHAKGGSGAAAGLGCFVQVDGAEHLLVLIYIVLEGVEQALGVLGGEDDAALDVGLGHAGEDADEVENHLGGGVGDDGQVGVDAFGYLGREFNLKLIVVFLIFHGVMSIYCIGLCG